MLPIFRAFASTGAEIPEVCTATISAIGATPVVNVSTITLLDFALVVKHKIRRLDVAYEAAFCIGDSYGNRYQPALHVELRLLRRQ